MSLGGSSRLRRGGALGPLVLWLLAGIPAGATADGLSLYLEPDYTHISTTTRDAQGHTSAQTTEEFAHHYRLGFSRSLAPLVRLDATGLFEQTIDWNTLNGVSSRADEWRSGGAVRLYLGSPVLGGDVGYERRDDSIGNSLAAGGRTHDVTDLYRGRLGWHPADLPSVDLTLSRTDNRDVARGTADLTTDTALLNVNYAAIRQLSLGYYLGLDRATDHVADTRTDSVNNSFRATYQDTFNGGRTSAIASYSFQNRLSSTASGGAGGTVTTPQLPAAGLFAIEAFPATPDKITLGANPALVDGNLTAPASVNLGFSVSVGGDTNAREMGVQFTDPTTPVNAIYVYVDRQLPAEIAGQYAWTAWRSDDNVTWTQVTLGAPAVFGAFQNRFEITFPETRARYLKVVARPLPVTAATDRRFSDVYVTEVQAALVVAASLVRGDHSSTSQAATAALHHQLLDSPLLAYDVSSTVSQSAGGGTYIVLNGLSADQRLGRVFDLQGRVARQDSGSWASNAASVHLASWQYSGALVAKPLPTLSHALTYTGQYGTTMTGTVALNAVTLVNRAELYRGLNAFASTGYVYNYLEKGLMNDGPVVNGTISVVPNQALTISSSFYYALVRQTGGGLPEQRTENERVEGSASFSPFPALYLSASLSRIVKGPRPTTLASFGGSFSPFPDGALLLRASYTESLDTASNQKSQLGTATSRWTIAAGAWLDLSYTVLDTSSDLTTTNTRALTAALVLTL